MSDSPWAPLEEALRNLPIGPAEPMIAISRQEIVDAARAVAENFQQPTASYEINFAIARAFKKFADKIESLP